MYKKSVVVGLLLFFSGICLFGGVLYGNHKEQVFLQQQRDIINSRLSQLGQSIDNNTDIYLHTEVLNDKLLERKLAKQWKLKEIRQLAFSISVTFMCTGGGIILFFLVSKIVRSMVAFNKVLKKHLVGIYRYYKKHKETSHCPRSGRGGGSDKYSVLLAGSGWQAGSQQQAESVDKLYGYKKKSVSLPSSKATAKSNVADTGGQLERNIRRTILPDKHQSTLQNSDLDKQISDVRQMADTVSQAVQQHSEPLGNIVEQLSEQVSAIREYASSQQEKIEKVHERDEWRITRNFCLRVIRCIDNIEKRIESFSAASEQTSQLQEVRDELIFTLEAGSVEQFIPELNSKYSGQEKRAEVVRQRVATDDAAMKGKISEVTRPGYLYVLDDKNVKVVRPALVKLFG